MARPKNTPEKIERMRNAMMDAVIDLLDQVSPEKVSIRMIADKVGVSHMVFYTYFKDRDEIMKVLVDRQKNLINQHFASKLEKTQSKSTKLVLKELLGEYAEAAEEHPKIFRLFWMSPTNGKKKKADGFKHLDSSFQSLTELIKVGMNKGEFTRRNERLTAATVMAIINGPIILDQCNKLPADISCRELLDQIIEAIFIYLES